MAVNLLLLAVIIFLSTVDASRGVKTKKLLTTKMAFSKLWQKVVLKNFKKELKFVFLERTNFVF